MKLVKPNKQTVLKGLLLLVVGLNFSWRPLLTEKNESSMASMSETRIQRDLDEAAEKSARAESNAAATASAAPTRQAPAAKPAAQMSVNGHQLTAPELAREKEEKESKESTDQYVKVCDGKFVTVKKQLDGSFKVIAVDDNKNALNCEVCLNSEIRQDSPGPLQTNMVMALKDALKLSCDQILTDKEKLALEEKKKQEETDKAELAEKMVKCEVNKKGEELDGNKKLDCEMKHLKMSDREMKKLGIDKDAAKEIREDIAKNALKDAKEQLNADVKACKRSHKEDASFEDCDQVLSRYDDVFGRFSESGNKILQDGSKSLTSKLEKFETFVTDEKKSAERVVYYENQYDKLDAAMQHAYDSHLPRCNYLASTHGPDFNVDACSAAYVKQEFEPTLMRLKSQFTTEENAFYRKFDSDKKVELIGQDGAAAAIAPWHEYTKELADFGKAYYFPTRDLPQLQSDVDTHTGLALNPLTIGADSGRFASVSGARPFIAMPTTSVPSVLSANGNANRYNGALPTANFRQNRAVTNGLFLPQASIMFTE